MAGAKDKRLYARFDIGFDEHDKIYPLSDAAFRALVEATLYARRQLTDGFLAERLAVKRWGSDVLDELASNDPQKPSLIRVDGGWLIHDFAEHQTTNADIEAKRLAGAKGGAAKARARRSPSTSVAGASEVVQRNGSTTLAKTETETETYINPPNPPSGGKRGSRLDPSWMPTKDDVAAIAEQCPGLDTRAEHPGFVDYWIAVPGQKGVKLDWSATWRNWMRRKFQDQSGARVVPLRAVGGRLSPGQKARSIADELRGEGL